MSFKQRVISSIVMGIVLVASIAFNSIGLHCLLSLSQIFICYEIASLPLSNQFFVKSEILGSILLIMTTLALNQHQHLIALSSLITYIFVALFIIFDLTGTSIQQLSTFLRYVLNTLISGVLITLGHLLIVTSPVVFLTQIILVVVNDSFAYFCGKLFGRHKLIALSPSKTWEGFIGGAFFTILLSRIAQNLSNFLLFSNENCTKVVQIQAFFIATAAPIGGFFGSMVKRSFGIKDFGNSIPGHGGFLDRWDCQIITFGISLLACKAFE